MSKTLLQIHFNFSGPFGEEMTQQLVGLAESINEEPGFIWKIWTESEKNQQAGGIYLFESEETAQAYIKKHTARLKNLGVDEVTFTLFGVNDALTENKSRQPLPLNHITQASVPVLPTATVTFISGRVPKRPLWTNSGPRTFSSSVCSASAVRAMLPFSTSIMKMVSLRKVMSSVIDRFIVRSVR